MPLALSLRVTWASVPGHPLDRLDWQRRASSIGASRLGLAQRFHDKIDLILHHLTDFTMPWTSNLAEQALRHAKIHLKISGCFRSLETTRAYCRIHSYPITIRLNAVPPMQAIRDALAGYPWTPLRALTTA